jgi:hypothetical protein
LLPCEAGECAELVSLAPQIFGACENVPSSAW